MAIKLEEVKRGLCFKGLRKDKKVGKYLVLAVSKYKVIYAMVNNYPTMDSLFIEVSDEFTGSVSIDMLQFMSINRFMSIFGGTGVPHGYLTSYQLHKISGMIYDFLDGRIVNASNGSFVYDFDLDAYEAGLEAMQNTCEKKSPKDEENESLNIRPVKDDRKIKANIQDDSQDDTSQNSSIPTQIQPDDSETIINTSTEGESATDDNESIEIIASDNSSIVSDDNSEENSDIDISPMIISNEELVLNGIVADTDTVYYDLLYRESSINKNGKLRRKQYPRKKSSKTGRRIYADHEVLKIAYMDIAQITNTFNVSICSAKLMKTNAKKILSAKSYSIKKTNNWHKLFENGMGASEIINLVKADEATSAIINMLYNSWLFDKSYSITVCKKDLIAKYKKLIEEGDIDTLDSVYKMSYKEFAKKEKCSRNTAYHTLLIIRNYLNSTSACYAIGFTNETLKSINKYNLDTAELVLDRALKLEWVYKKYFEDRASVITGLMPINENISNSDKDFVIAMLKNVSSTRNAYKYLTDTQKDVIAKSDATVSDYMIAFATRNTMANGIKNRIDKGEIKIES